MQSPNTRRPSSVAAVLAALAVAGCGDSHGSTHSASTPETAPTTAASPAKTSPTASQPTAPVKTEKVPDIDIPVKTFAPREPIPARYTCDGANVPPPLRWGRVPKGTVEIDLFVTNLAGDGTETTDWAVAGLKPNLRLLASGHLPAGAIVGRNSDGQTRYSVCPPKGPKANYFVLLIPLPRHIPVSPGFEGQSLSAKAVRVAAHEGEMSFEYLRQ
jgi:hypothetical protein